MRKKESVKMEWKRRKKMLWCLPVLAMVAAALFWTIWYIAVGSMPEVHVTLTTDWGMEVSFALSRWLDIPCAGISALILVAIYTAPRINGNGDKFARVMSKLVTGLFLCLIGGLFCTLIFGLFFGLIVGLIAGLFFGLIGGLSIMCRLLFTKKFWQNIGREFKLIGRAISRWINLK